MTADGVKVWQRVIRDTLTWMLGMFVIVYQLLTNPLDPSIIWLTTGATLIGIPPAFRINERSTTKPDGKDGA